MNKTVNEHLLDPEYLEEILGSFRQATGLHIEAVNNKGETFSIPGGRTRCEFCEFIRSKPDGEKKCRESYRRANSEAVKWDEPYFFRCHAGLVIWAVPIVVEGMALGSIICGQALMWKPDQLFFQELKKTNSSGYEELKERAVRLEVLSPERCQAAADMLYVVVNHIVKRNLHVLEKLRAHKLQQQQLRDDLEQRKKSAHTPKIEYNQYLKKERRFLQYIRLGDRTRAKSNLQSLLTDLYVKTIGNQAAIEGRVLELAALVSRAAVEGGADADTSMRMLDNFNQEMAGSQRVEEFFYNITRIIDQFIDNIFALADKKHLSLVKDARKFIMENYARDIKIGDVSGHLFISPSHLSRLFRKELDCTVNDYLTRVRVENSVELMKKPELSVQQVAQAVGFQSQSYFAKVFKRYIGVTPLTYKNSLF